MAIVPKIFGILDYAQLKILFPQNVIVNGDFETGTLVNWFDPASVASVNSKHEDLSRGSKYACNLEHSDYGIVQYINPPIPVEDIVDLSCQILAENPDSEQLKVTFLLTDSTSFGFRVTKATLANNWEYRNLMSSLRTQLYMQPDLRKKFIYAVMFSNIGTTDGLYVDDILMLRMPPEWKRYAITLNDVNATAAAGATAESDNAGLVNVVPGQIICISLEYSLDNPFFITNSSAQVRITLRNADGTVNETLNSSLFSPTTSWAKHNCFVTIPSGVAYLGVHGYINNQETGSRTLRLRNITVYPVFTNKVTREGKIVPISISPTAAGSTTVYTPTSGMKAKILGFYLYCDADITWELRFATSGNVIAGLPTKGAIAMNLIGLNPPKGGKDETVEIYVSGAANIKGWIAVAEE